LRSLQFVRARKPLQQAHPVSSILTILRQCERAKRRVARVQVRRIKGEAVATLTSVVADIASLLLSVEGYGYHPMFLIHDSPREADLSGAAYAGFLTKIYELSENLGADTAPFQYIITTTTRRRSN